MWPFTGPERKKHRSDPAPEEEEDIEEEEEGTDEEEDQVLPFCTSCDFEFEDGDSCTGHDIDSDAYAGTIHLVCCPECGAIWGAFRY